MLLTEYAEVRWSTTNKAYYESIGYEYTKIGDSFLVKVDDLSCGSSVKVEVKCDYHADGCKDISLVRWADYVKMKQKNPDNKKDCCNNRKCTVMKQTETNVARYGTTCTLQSDDIKEKAQKTNLEKYGVKNPFESSEIQAKIKKTNLEKYGYETPLQSKDVQEKIKKTNLEKYGVENPFESDEIKKKIRKTNLEKYGVEVPTQNPEIREKGNKTCLEKYGVKNYGAIYSDEHKGELSPTWKGGAKYHRVERSTYEYRYWRKQVFERDSYTCQNCGDKSRKNHRVSLAAHHIKNWNDNMDCRYDVNNGITLCERCHLDFHSKYGKKNNTLEQLNEFLSLDKKVC